MLRSMIPEPLQLFKELILPRLGKVRKYDPRRGYGFIEDDPDFFIHANDYVTPVINYGVKVSSGKVDTLCGLSPPKKKVDGKHYSELSRIPVGGDMVRFCTRVDRQKKVEVPAWTFADDYDSCVASHYEKREAAKSGLENTYPVYYVYLDTTIYSPFRADNKKKDFIRDTEVDRKQIFEGNDLDEMRKLLSRILSRNFDFNFQRFAFYQLMGQEWVETPNPLGPNYNPEAILKKVVTVR